jgi:hypothetical protein
MMAHATTNTRTSCHHLRTWHAHASCRIWGRIIWHTPHVGGTCTLHKHTAHEKKHENHAAGRHMSSHVAAHAASRFAAHSSRRSPGSTMSSPSHVAATLMLPLSHVAVPLSCCLSAHVAATLMLPLSHVAVPLSRCHSAHGFAAQLACRRSSIGRGHVR